MNVNANYPLLSVATVVPVKTTQMISVPRRRASTAAIVKANTIFKQTAALAKFKAR